MKISLKSCLIIAVITIMITPYAAQAESYRIAVLNFNNRAGLSADDLDYLTDAEVRGEVRNLLPDNFMIMTKENMVALLADHNIKLEDAECEADCAVECWPENPGALYHHRSHLERPGKVGLLPENVRH